MTVALRDNLIRLPTWQTDEVILRVANGWVIFALAYLKLLFN